MCNKHAELRAPVTEMIQLENVVTHEVVQLSDALTDNGRPVRIRIDLFCPSSAVFCLGRFCRARRPAPFWWNDALPFWPPKKKNYVSHTWLLALFCPFCFPHTALIVLCLFHCPFTALIVPFSSVHRANCALFRWHPALLKTWAEHCSGNVNMLLYSYRN